MRVAVERGHATIAHSRELYKELLELENQALVQCEQEVALFTEVSMPNQQQNNQRIQTRRHKNNSVSSHFVAQCVACVQRRYWCPRPCPLQSPPKQRPVRQCVRDAVVSCRKLSKPVGNSIVNRTITSNDSADEGDATGSSGRLEHSRLLFEEYVEIQAGLAEALPLLLMQLEIAFTTHGIYLPADWTQATKKHRKRPASSTATGSSLVGGDGAHANKKRRVE